MGRKKNRLGLGKLRLGPFFYVFLAGGAVLFFALAFSGRIRWGRPAEPSAAARTTPWERESCLAALTEFLNDKAKWRGQSAAAPLDWKGELPAAASLVQWNATVTEALENLGLEVFSGTEEIIDGRGHRPLHRLTLVAGRAGETLATIMVEMPRKTETSPVF